MKRTRIAVAAVCLALAVALAGWLALRGRAASEQGAAPAAAPLAAPDVRPAAELAAPQGEGEPAPAERVAVASAESAAPAGSALIVIQDARGSPVPGVRWALFRGADVLAQGTAEADGVATFARTSGEAQLLVAPSARPPQVFAIDLALERQTVELAEGVAIAGIVLVDGLPPREPLALSLGTSSTLLAAGALPEAAWKTLGLRARAGAVKSLDAATGAGGAFRFDGLPEGTTGKLFWPQQLNLVADTDEEGVKLRAGLLNGTLVVEAPAEDLVLRLQTSPRITGRVVQPGTGAPVPGAYVSIAWTDTGSSTEAQTSADKDGAFALSMAHRLPARIEVRVADAEESGEQDYELEPPSGASTFDTGPLAILPTRTVACIVRDVLDAPISGASVRELPARDEGRGEGWTDAAGGCALRVATDAPAVRASAVGYESAEAPLPTGDGPLVITLRPGTVLEVRLSGDAKSLGLRLSGDEAPFAKDGKPSWMPDPPQRGPLSFSVPEHGYVSFQDVEDGIYVLTGVRPGLTLALSVTDTYGATLLEQSVGPLAPGERRVVELAVEAPAGVVEGRVVDKEGAPIEGASLSVALAAGGAARSSGLDSQGRFRIAGLAAAPVRIHVQAAGYVPLAVVAQPIPAGPPLELVLDRGRSVRVRVHGPDGTPVPLAFVGIPLEGSWPMSAHNAEPGVFLLEHAPLHALTVVATAGGRTFERAIPAGSDPQELDVEIPAWQSCTVRLSGPAELREQRVCVELTASEGDPQRRYLEHGSGDELRFDVVFPGRYTVSAVLWNSGVKTSRSDTVAVEVALAAPASVTLELSAP